ALRQHRDAAVVFSTGDPAPFVLAGDEAPLPVPGVPVRVARGLAEDADRARLLFPLEDAVVRDVAPQQVAPVAEPHRPFTPAEPGAQPLDLRGVDAVAREALVEDADGGVRVARARL